MSDVCENCKRSLVSLDATALVDGMCGAHSPLLTDRVYGHLEDALRDCARAAGRRADRWQAVADGWPRHPDDCPASRGAFNFASGYDFGPAWEREFAKALQAEKDALRAVRAAVPASGDRCVLCRADDHVETHCPKFPLLENDAERLAAARARVRELEAERERMLAALPQCSGQWVEGLGGYRAHEPCSRVAVYWRADDVYSYCARHITEEDRARYDEAPWARWEAATVANHLPATEEFCEE